MLSEILFESLMSDIHNYYKTNRKRPTYIVVNWYTYNTLKDYAEESGFVPFENEGGSTEFYNYEVVVRPFDYTEDIQYKLI